MFYFDYYYVILVVPALILSLWAQSKVSSTYSKYSKKHSVRGVTANQVARDILDSNGLNHIPIEHISGNLTDHYDPKTKVVRLSDSVYQSSSIAAIGVAAHEVGHAVQHSVSYAPLKARNGIFPAVSFANKLALPVALLGAVLSYPNVIVIGLALFSLTVLFQLITLPVEFNASKRALMVLETDGYLTPDEIKGTKKVLSAAAMTYVAAALTSIASFLRLVLIFFGNNRRRR
ncbi:MAG: zinc metallopeptidase [Clostridia bacterium]|nr:zinc metallopeptidase [Clostridia bacterium]